jgi:hypothetical protein
VRRFTSFGQMSRFLAERAVELPHAQKQGLEKAACLIEEEARAVVGHYQEAAGPFPAWDPLAESTQEERQRLGFTPNDPLLRTGSLRDSIDHKVEDDKALIGSADPRMKWLELGPPTWCPRKQLTPMYLVRYISCKVGHGGQTQAT